MPKDVDNTDIDHVVRPLAADTWDAFAGLVERHNGIFGGCWCIYFLRTASSAARVMRATVR